VREWEGERVCEGEENGGKEMAAGCFPGRLQSGKEGKNFGVGKWRERESVPKWEFSLHFPPFYTPFPSMISCQVPP